MSTTEIRKLDKMLMLIAGMWIGYMVGQNNGWISAHNEVARECERLGSFYVVSKVFKCVEVQDERAKG